MVARGDPASVEYREAKRWLAAVGCPSRSSRSPSAGSAPAKKAGPEAAATPEKLVGGRLVGRMEWPGIDPAVRSIRGEMWISRRGSVDGKREAVAPDQPGWPSTHFYDIPPGQYRITARLFVAPKDVTVWDQKVTVEDGRPTELVLTPATALVPPDKFPPPPAS